VKRNDNWSAAIANLISKIFTQKFQAGARGIVVVISALIAFANEYSKVDTVERPPIP
jgi:hypothetical protein